MRVLFSKMGVLLLFLMNTPAQAQVTPYVHDSTVNVFANGQLQTLAWCGGFSPSQVSMGDLNHDGLQDLVLFQPWGGVYTYINQGAAGNPDFRYAPEYEVNFPPVYDYLILADYNCDGVPDLFQQGQVGFAVYTGYYNAANQLCFTFYKNLFYEDSLTGGTPANAYVEPGNIPAIVDVDNDGDLDFLSYSVDGQLTWYKNMRVELGLPCDSIQIELASECWGIAGHGFRRPFDLGVCGGVAFSGNSLCLFDYDMDGDYDQLSGNISFNQIGFLLNGRVPFNPSGPDSMVSQDTAWQSGGTPVNIAWPSAFNVDLDQDGKKDLVISANEPGENYNCFWYYKNFTTPGVPNWQFQSDSFLTSQSIDLGTAAYPMFFDYNKDGLPDLFIGSDGYYQDSSGSLLSQVSYYQNTSTPGNPSFTLQTKDFLGIKSDAFKGAAPAFGDIDNDGIADMVIGHTNGTLSYFKNMAASDAVQPNWQLTEVALTDVNGDTINVGSYAAPFIYDVDKDGKKDLVIGNFYGAIAYYQNVSTTPGSISLKLVNAALGHVGVDSRYVVGNFSAPFIGKVDSSGTDYLLIGSNSGNLYLYTGFQTGDTTAAYTLIDSQFSYVDSLFNEYNHPGLPCGIYGNLRSTVTVGDVAGDGNLRMVVGNAKGGVELYTQYANSLGVSPVNKNNTVLVFPNPTTQQLYIENASTGTSAKIFNVLGQQVYNGNIANNKELINTANLLPGAYLLQLTDNNGYPITKTVMKE